MTALSRLARFYTTRAALPEAAQPLFATWMLARLAETTPDADWDRALAAAAADEVGAA